MLDGPPVGRIPEYSLLSKKKKLEVVGFRDEFMVFMFRNGVKGWQC